MNRRGHGGSRPGAGRPPVLTVLEQLAVGRDCEDAWLNAIRRGQERELDRRVPDARALWAEMERLSPGERRQLIKLRDTPEEIDLPHLADIAVELEAHAEALDGSDDRQGAGRIIAASRPRGLRATIIAEVSAARTASYGRRISPRLVRESWELLRRTERWVRETNQ